MSKSPAFMTDDELAHADASYTTMANTNKERMDNALLRNERMRNVFKGQPAARINPAFTEMHDAIKLEIENRKNKNEHS